MIVITLEIVPTLNLYGGHLRDKWPRLVFNCAELKWSQISSIKQFIIPLNISLSTWLSSWLFQPRRGRMMNGRQPVRSLTVTTHLFQEKCSISSSYLLMTYYLFRCGNQKSSAHNRLDQDLNISNAKSLKWQDKSNCKEYDKNRGVTGLKILSWRALQLTLTSPTKPNNKKKNE